MFDDNCSLHTAAAIYNLLNKATLRPSEVADRTGFMEGPGHAAQAVAEMFRQLQISDGTYSKFDTLDRAEALMKMRALGTPFGFAYQATAGGMGHIMVAIKGLGEISYYDHQIHERQGPYMPINVSRGAIPQVGYQYWVFRPGLLAPTAL